MDVKDYTLGQRIQSHRDSESAANGEFNGEVVKLGRKYVHVLFDESGKVRQVLPESVHPARVAPAAPVTTPASDEPENSPQETVTEMAATHNTLSYILPTPGRKAHREHRQTKRRMARASRRANRKR